jgi:hypothetical protein
MHMIVYELSELEHKLKLRIKPFLIKSRNLTTRKYINNAQYLYLNL